MSQAGILSDSTSAAADIETLTGDSGGAVGPDAAFNVDIVGGVGITTTGTPGSNEVSIGFTAGLTGTATTVGAVTGDIITHALGATPGTFVFQGRVSAFESTGPSGAGYRILATFRTDGAAATQISLDDKFHSEDAALAAADVDLIASGNNVIVQATGVAALTLNWAADFAFTSVT